VDQSVRLRAFCAAVFAAIFVAASAFAAAGDPSAATDAEKANQVLEIPQQCSQDAVSALCDRSDADTTANGDGAAASADGGSSGSDTDASGAAESDGGDAYGTEGDAVADDNNAGAQDNSAMAASPADTTNGTYGSVYDYQNQHNSYAPEMVRPYVVPMPGFVPVVPMVPAYAYPRAYSNAPVYSNPPAYSYWRVRRPALWRRYAPRPARLGRPHFTGGRPGRR
jgi:hypothetical protein